MSIIDVSGGIMKRVMANKKRKEYLELYAKYKFNDYDNKDIQRLLLEMQPKKLYKYRRCNKNTYNSIKKDYAWFQVPKKFDDTRDSIININFNKEVKTLTDNKLENVEKLENDLLRYMVQKRNIDISDENILIIKNMLKQDEKIDINKLKSIFGSKYSEDEYEEAQESFNSGLFKEIMECVEAEAQSLATKNNSSQEENYCFCMAETDDNDLLWSMYGDEFRGICIEYSIPYLIDGFVSLYRDNMAPVFYGTKKQLKVIDIFKDIFDDELYEMNNIELIVQQFIKNKKWQNQDEWRISIPNDGINEKYFPYISKIILGERIEEKNKNRIINICQRKSIPVFQRTLDFSKTNVILKKIKLKK